MRYGQEEPILIMLLTKCSHWAAFNYIFLSHGALTAGSSDGKTLLSDSSRKRSCLLCPCSALGAGEHQDGCPVLPAKSCCTWGWSTAGSVWLCSLSIISTKPFPPCPSLGHCQATDTLQLHTKFQADALPAPIPCHYKSWKIQGGKNSFYRWVAR